MNLPQDAYNPSLCRHAGKLWLTARTHDRGDWRTNLYLAELDPVSLQPCSCSKIEPPATLKDHSHEDARIFSFQNELWMSWTVSQWPATQFRCAICVGRIIREGDNWAVSSYFFPKHGRNDFSGLEKNWSPFVVRDQLWFYYATKDSEQTFIRMDGTRIAEVATSRSLPWAYGDIHGGAIVALPSGNLAHIFNSRTGSLAVATHRYHCGIAELSIDRPFEMLRISKRPVLYGQEGYNLNGHKFFKPNVVFCCGAVVADNQVYASFGWNDAKAKIVKLREEDFKL